MRSQQIMRLDFWNSWHLKIRLDTIGLQFNCQIPEENNDECRFACGKAKGDPKSQIYINNNRI